MTKTIFYTVLCAPWIDVKLSQNHTPVPMKLIARPEPTEFTSCGICWCSKARYKLHIALEHARVLFKASYTYHFIVRNPQSSVVNLAGQRALYGHLRNLEH